MSESVRAVLSEVPAPEPEVVDFDSAKWKRCLCGCKGLIPISHSWNYLKGHKGRPPSAPSAPVAGESSIAQAIRVLEVEIARHDAEISKLKEAVVRLKALL